MKREMFRKVFNTMSILIVAGFFVFSYLIGGSSWLGYFEAGNYYVGDHGQYTQVNEVIWNISYVWTLLFWLIIVANIIVYAIVLNIRKKT